MTFIALLVLLQTPPLPSPPPLVPLDAPLDVPLKLEGAPTPPPAPPLFSPMERPGEPVPEPLPVLENAVLFSPTSLFGLYVSVEYERRLTSQLTAFAAGGIGALSTAGFDVGTRLYPVDHVFESFFMDVRFSGFAMFAPTAKLFLVGPMLELGYAWRIRSRLLLSIGAGAAMWFGVDRAAPTATFILGGVTSARVFILPGFYQPLDGQVGVQPTIRFTIGPGF